MRRVIGLSLAGVGAFLLVVAILLRTFVAGQVIKFPLNEYLKTTLTGSGISYFSGHLLREVNGANVTVTSTIQSVPHAGSSSTAVWRNFTYLYDTTNKGEVSYTKATYAFNRRTAELTNCCGASINGNSSIRQSGLLGFLWPFGTQKKTYQVWDNTLNKPRPAQFAGTSVIDGIPVYKFVEQVALTRAGTLSLPPSLVGMTGQTWVTLPEYYSATNTFWVDPVTGAELNTIQDQNVVLEDSAGVQQLLLMNGSLAMTPQSVQTVVNLDKTGRTQYEWVEVIAPLLAGIVGLIALIAGIVLARRPRDEQPDGADTEVSEPALDPAV